MTSTSVTEFDKVIDSIITDIKETTEFKITDKHKRKIKDGLENSFNMISNKKLEENKELIIKKVSSALKRNNTWWSKTKNLFGFRAAYEISSKNVAKIATQEVESLGIAFKEADQVRSTMYKKANILKKVIPRSIDKELKERDNNRHEKSGRVH